MKKIDLHVHTIKTISDSEFQFSMHSLISYVKEMQIDAIAITNHNLFEKKQFEEICDALDIIVFPGIEINIGVNGGHILVISEKEDVDDFASKCMIVEEKIQQPTDTISLEDFKKIFGNLKKYLLIPHFDKSPSVDKKIINSLNDYIFAGEVSSAKKFIYCKKNEILVPVMFSDWRPTDNSNFPVKQTYVDAGTLSLSGLKQCFRDKTKVHLSAQEGHHLFQVLPGINISTGLTVVIGGRSSGKSYTLNRINEEHDNIKYIRQFSLLEKEPEKAEAEFSRSMESQQSQFVQEFLRPFSVAVNDVSSIDLKHDEKRIEASLNT